MQLQLWHPKFCCIGGCTMTIKAILSYLILSNMVIRLLSCWHTTYVRLRHLIKFLRFRWTQAELQMTTLLMQRKRSTESSGRWNLFYSLKKFGLGKNVITWIKFLYSSSKASVRTNPVQSYYFPLYRSTRQGCPLSPLLFALAIEPLSIRPANSGIYRYGIHVKVSLYANDLLLLLSNLSVSNPAALATLETFGQVSGCKLNFSKSEIVTINDGAKQFPQHKFPFKIAHNNFTHLGIKVTLKFKDLYKANFTTQKHFDCWLPLNLSLVARVNAVKICVLPRFSYLFHVFQSSSPRCSFVNQTV